MTPGRNRLDQIEKARRERENGAFHEWWKTSGHADDPIFTLTMENCAHAAWQARATAAEATVAALKVACPCTTFEQDEDCQVGYPSLLCSACDGTGKAPMDKVVALAAEMMKIAEQVDELEDPFAAWETVELIKSQNDQLSAALEPFAKVEPMDVYEDEDEDARGSYILTQSDFRRARNAYATIRRTPHE